MADNQITEAIVLGKIYVIRGKEVMLDEDLAELYEVKTQQLNQQVKRNLGRFPGDFMFELSREEFDDLKAGPGATSWGGRRKLPRAFTEHGVLMLSSVLRSERAIEVNIQIMRVFTRMRQVLASSQELLTRMEQIEGRLIGHDEHIELIFDYLRKMLEEPVQPRRTIGYRRHDEGDQS